MRSAALLTLLPVLAAAAVLPDAHAPIRKSVSYGPSHKHSSWELHPEHSVSITSHGDPLKVAASFIAEKLGTSEGDGFYIREDVSVDLPPIRLTLRPTHGPLWPSSLPCICSCTHASVSVRLVVCCADSRIASSSGCACCSPHSRELAPTSRVPGRASPYTPLPDVADDMWLTTNSPTQTPGRRSRMCTPASSSTASRSAMATST